MLKIMSNLAAKAGSAWRFTTGGMPAERQRDRALPGTRGHEARRKKTSGDVFEAQNINGMIANGIRLAVLYMNGESGLRPNVLPIIGDATGFDQDGAREFSERVEERFALWAENADECHIRGELKLHQLAEAGALSYMIDGEAFWAIPHVERPGARSKTKVDCIHAARVRQPNITNDMTAREGIEIDEFGAALAYWIDVPNVEKTQGFKAHQPKRYLARTRFGRRLIVHTRDPLTDGLRGTSPVAPALKAVERYCELNAQAVKSFLFANSVMHYIKTDLGADQAAKTFRTDPAIKGSNSNDCLVENIQFWNEQKVDFAAGARGVFLPANSDVIAPAHPENSAEYKSIAEHHLREVARAIGISYEELSSDGKQSSYSSARLSNAISMGMAATRRTNILEPFYQSVFAAWLEEAIEAEEIAIPGGHAAFVANRGAFTRAQWIGPAKFVVDPEKAAKANERLLDMHATTRNQAALEATGQSFDAIIAQRAIEEQRIEELNMRDLQG